MTQQPLPGASTALTMGIISVVGVFFCCGPFAMIFSFIGLSNAKSAEKRYKENSEIYTGYENVKTGKVLSYIGLGISLIMLLITILCFGSIVAIITNGGFDGDF